MAFPLNKKEANYIVSKRFGLRSGRSISDANGAAYALDEGLTSIKEPYKLWDFHLSNTLFKIQDFPGSEKRFLLFISPANTVSTAERYKLSELVGIGDYLTFPKVNSLNGTNVTIHEYTEIGTKPIVSLMEWVFKCINKYGH